MNRPRGLRGGGGPQPGSRTWDSRVFTGRGARPLGLCPARSARQPADTQGGQSERTEAHHRDSPPATDTGALHLETSGRGTLGQPCGLSQVLGAARTQLLLRGSTTRLSLPTWSGLGLGSRPPAHLPPAQAGLRPPQRSPERPSRPPSVPEILANPPAVEGEGRRRPSAPLLNLISGLVNTQQLQATGALATRSSPALRPGTGLAVPASDTHPTGRNRLPGRASAGPPHRRAT